MNDKDKARFWSKVARAGDDECWLWTAGVFWDGYGRFKLNGKQRKAHRMSLELAIGKQTANVLHSCNNPRCVNPKHLRYGTQKDNVADMMAAKRNVSRKGEKHHKAKLTKCDVLAIRVLCKTRQQSDVAKQFGITDGHVNNIVKRRCWNHV